MATPEDQAKGNDAAGGTGAAEHRPQPSLDACNGVLAPPRIGDRDMRMQPPDKGTTPVIPPGAIPPQTPE